MCGIFCTVCASTDEVLSKRKKIVEATKPFLLRRGPDSFGEKQISCSLSNDGEKFEGKHSQNGGVFFNISAVVLHLRGECVTEQPVEDDFGNVLVWNGEIFAGLEVPLHQSDTTTLLRNLSTTSNDFNGVGHLLNIMSRIRGPWAFVYYQAKQHTLWFGRDYFGRRSLLWHIPASSTDLFAFSSVGTRLTEEAGEQFWKEVPANGIYSINLRKLCEYFSIRDENTINLESVLRRYPWQQSSSFEYPICPVRNSFNGELPEDNSIHHSINESESTSLQLPVGENMVESMQNNIPDNLASGSNLGPDFSQNDITRTSSAANRDLTQFEYVNSLTHPLADCHVHAVEDNIRTSVQVDVDAAVNHEVTQPDFLPYSTEKNNRRAVGQLCKVSPDNKPVHEDQDSNVSLRERHVSQNVVEQFADVLLEAVRKRVFNLPRRKVESNILTGKVRGNDSSDERAVDVCGENKPRTNVGILFSGGLDSIVLAALADRCIPADESIDLINVAFEQKKTRAPKPHSKERKKQKTLQRRNDTETHGVNFDVPDRITGRHGVAELNEINPGRIWNFVEVNVTLEELQNERSNYITHLVCPQSTVLDDSIGCALWFAARGKGHVTCKPCLDNIKELQSSCNHLPSYTCPAKVLLVGMGADEQLGGYARHRSRFNKEGWKGLVDEIEMEVQRISERNLGRDDRCISDHGRESRYPYLDEDVVSFLNGLPVWIKCDPRLPRGVGEKILLRQVAKFVGLKASTELPKRAIQFGSRIAKLESSTEKGNEKCSRF